MDSARIKQIFDEFVVGFKVDDPCMPVFIEIARIARKEALEEARLACLKISERFIINQSLTRGHVADECADAIRALAKDGGE